MVPPGLRHYTSFAQGVNGRFRQRSNVARGLRRPNSSFKADGFAAA